MKTLIVAFLIFLFIAVGGVVGYLYFVAEPKRHTDEPATSTEPETSKPVDKDQEVPMPGAGPSQSSQPQKQKQDVPKTDTEPTTPQEQPAPEPPTQEKPIAEPPANVVKPVLIERVNPEYPEVARKARVEGIVILEAIITQNGHVENAKVLRGVHPLLDQAAVNAVRKWRYKPATLNGKPVRVHSTVTVNFKLK
jgi:protein TonB